MSVPDLEAGLLDGLDDELQCGAVAGQIGGEAALVTQTGRVALGLQHALERVVDLRALAQRLGEGVGAQRRDHELLHVDRRVGVRAAVDDVHHRHGQQVGVRPAEVAEQRQAGGLRGRLGHGERDAEDRVGPEALLVGGAVQVDHGLVDQALLGGVEAEDRGGDLVLDVAHRLRRRPCPGSGSCPRRAARRPRRHRSRRPRARRRAPSIRPRAPPRPRRSGCRANRGSHARSRHRYLPLDAPIRLLVRRRTRPALALPTTLATESPGLLLSERPWPGGTRRGQEPAASAARTAPA